jgi:vitamin B12 transporter
VVELEDFVLVNIRGGYKLTDNTEIYARVENLLDEEYEEVYTFGGSGRVAIAGMRVNF